ncbi:hypothetical protein ACH61_03247 [Rathayibacter tanaceti]|uniref:Uncharacterized protein n=1 Tax=Rathayibacter tanaceti TaxID=1671680 RepID=A0A166GZJ1_9MICO|nr:hypothetical protein ACH61_03247 [Rathayibacter tanaceti]
MHQHQRLGAGVGQIAQQHRHLDLVRADLLLVGDSALVVDDEPDEQIVQARLDQLPVLQQHGPLLAVPVGEEEAPLEHVHENAAHLGVEDAAIAREELVRVLLHCHRGDERIDGGLGGLSHRRSPSR